MPSELDMINGCTCLPKYPGWSPCEGCQFNKLRHQLRAMSALVDGVVTNFNGNMILKSHLEQDQQQILNPEDTQNEKEH